MAGTVGERPEPTDSSTRPQKRRWSYVCLWRSTWSQTGYARMFRYIRGPSICMLSTPIRKRSADLDGFRPPNGAKSKWPRYRLPLPRTPEPHRQLPEAGAQPVGSGDDRATPTKCQDTAGEANTYIPDRVAFGLPIPALRSSEKQLGGGGGVSLPDQ